jgi:hypothetical protein
MSAHAGSSARICPSADATSRRYAELNTAQPMKMARPNRPANAQPVATATVTCQRRTTSIERTTNVVAQSLLSAVHSRKSVFDHTPRPRDLSLTTNHATSDANAWMAKAVVTRRGARSHDRIVGGAGDDMRRIMSQPSERRPADGVRIFHDGCGTSLRERPGRRCTPRTEDSRRTAQSRSRSP